MDPLLLLSNYFSFFLPLSLVSFHHSNLPFFLSFPLHLIWSLLPSFFLLCVCVGFSQKNRGMRVRAIERKTEP